jgi:hypothetical protein
MQAVVFKKEGYVNLQVPLPAVVQVLSFCWLICKHVSLLKTIFQYLSGASFIFVDSRGIY